MDNGCYGKYDPNIMGVINMKYVNHICIMTR